jgi:hypothetical protein
MKNIPLYGEPSIDKREKWFFGVIIGSVLAGLVACVVFPVDNSYQNQMIRARRAVRVRVPSPRLTRSYRTNKKAA